MHQMGQWMRQSIHLSVPPALSIPATLDKFDRAGDFADVQCSVQKLAGPGKKKKKKKIGVGWRAKLLIENSR